MAKRGRKKTAAPKHNLTYVQLFKHQIESLERLRKHNLIPREIRTKYGLVRFALDDYIENKKTELYKHIRRQKMQRKAIEEHLRTNSAQKEEEKFN